MTLHSQSIKLFSSLCLVSLAALLSVGCDSDSEPDPVYGCARKGPCPTDPTPTSEQAEACEKLSSDVRCGEAFTAYSTCAFSAKQCTDAGLSDPILDSTSEACASSYAKYTTCLGDKINDPGAAGAGGSD